MRHTGIGIIVLSTLCLCLGVLPAWAGDEGEGDTPAEKAYRDAWWAETSTGALDRALEGYQEAADAEGPDSVRALALYRMAVVFERIGRTDEAIRALERLAKEFPREADLQSKARERLEEWTAVDLRTNFEEWYRRYQYSPEFQARIVDLVLTLSAAVNDHSTQQAEREILTIGEAAIPALAAHLDSSNVDLRQRAVCLLMLLGEIPEARHLIETSKWRAEQGNWTLLLSASPETQARLRSGIEGDGLAQSVLRGALGDSEGRLAALAQNRSRALLNAILGSEVDAPLIRGLKDLVGSFEGAGGADSFSRTLALALRSRGYVDDGEVLEWLSNDSERVRRYAAELLADGSVCPDGALEAIIEAMNDTPLNDLMQRYFNRALVGVLEHTPDTPDLDPAARAVERAWPGLRIEFPVTLRGSTTFSTQEPASVPLCAVLVNHASDSDLATSAFKSWCQASRGDATTTRRLLEWALESTDPEIRRLAARTAGEFATAADLDDVLGALELLEPAFVNAVLTRLSGRPDLQGLGWTDEQLRRLMDRGASGSVSPDVFNRFFRTLLRPRHRVEQVIRLGLDAPHRLGCPGVSIAFVDRGGGDAPDLAERIRDGFREAWADWSLKEKQAALGFFPPFWRVLGEDDDFTAFLREQLRAELGVPGKAAKPELQRGVKGALLALLPTVDLAEVRAVYDLSTPQGALAAWATGRLPHTAEVYEALAAASEAEDSAERREYLQAWTQRAEDDMWLRAARDMAVDADAVTRRDGLNRLSDFRVADDIRVFAKALEDPSSVVRFAAARALAYIYDADAIESLVKALDDPAPGVRDRVLQTLEAIREIEEKKQYWREFAEKAR